MQNLNNPGIILVELQVFVEFLERSC